MIILGTNSIKDTGYDVANSCRFNDGDSAQMKKDATSSDSIVDATISMWVKRGTLGTAQVLFAGNYKSSNLYFCSLSFDSSDRLSFKNSDNGTNCEFVTNRVFRDCSTWYYICVECDLSDSAADRVKIYINGTTRETSFSTSTNMSGDQFFLGKSGYEVGVGALQDGSYFDGYMAEVCYIDGNAAGSPLTPTSFGEYDEDTPTVWKPKDVSGLSFGANGFYLDFEDSSNLGNDKNGGTDLTESNLAAADQATDTCTNNFCTLNPLIPSSGYTFSEGNCKFVTGSGDTTGAGVGTFGLTAGKWYWEVKIGESGEDWRNHTHGIISELTTELYQNVGGLQNDTGVTQWMNNDGGEVVVDGTATTADYGELAIDDILGIAFNADDSQITFLKNGSALVSNYTISTTRGTIFPFIKTGINTVSEVNWGGCSAFTVSSAASDANGYGNFEHAPPSGYLALCSKNLGSDGG